MTSSREWRSVDGYNHSYEVSNDGCVRSIGRTVKHRYGGMRNFPGKILKQRTDHRGYWMVSLWVQGKAVNCMTHRLVAAAFCDNPESKPFVNHKDGDKSNSHADNLEWVTQSENISHAIEMGLYRRGEGHQTAKLSEMEARTVKYTPLRVSSAARRFGISPSTVCGIRSGLTWRHI